MKLVCPRKVKIPNGHKILSGDVNHLNHLLLKACKFNGHIIYAMKITEYRHNYRNGEYTSSKKIEKNS